jgi:hypothetical protein
MAVFWDTEPCSLVDTERCFWDAYCLRHQSVDNWTALMMEAVSASETSPNIYQTICRNIQKTAILQLCNYCQ